MSTPSTPVRPVPDDGASLLAHLGWIRRLARKLAEDDHRAEDLVQETCVVALGAQPRDPSSFRGWLRTILQNLARQGGRRARHRRERESRADRPSEGEAADELLERAELQRRIVDTVLGLEEPYRSTILLRFFEDLPPREIARRQGVPATTVQSRLTRALQRLRERLTERGGRGGVWSLLLLPSSAPPKGLSVPVLGGLVVNAKAILVVLSLGAAITLAAFLGLEPADPGRGTSLSSAPEVARPAAATLSSGLAPGGAGTQRAELGAPAQDAPAVAGALAAKTPLNKVRGRVLDGQGAPVGGLAVVFETGDDPRSGGKAGIEARSGAAGLFELETTAATGWIAAKDERLATVRKGSFRASSAIEAIVIVAPAIDVGGTVVDPQRVPLQGARVSLALPKGFGARFGTSLEATRVVDWSTLTDAAGRFALARIPQVAGASVRVLVDGYEPAIQPEPEFPDPGLSFVLQRPATVSKGALRGRVLDEDGRPVADARVAAGVASTVTTEKGEFALDLSRAVTASAVTAVKPGFRPARLERPGEPAGDDTGWPDFVELRLGGPALAIRGQVVDSARKPLPRMRVWIADPTPFGLIGRMPAQSENLMAGAPVPAYALEPDPGPAKEDGDNSVVNRNSGGPPTACWNWVVTDDEGRFEISGLDDRKYKLRVLDPKTLQMSTSDPIRAGEGDARIVMPEPALYARLAGRVTTVGERPVGGLRLLLRTTCFDVHTRYFGGTLDVLMMNESTGTVTDENGRFEFHGVPREGIFFVLRSDLIVPCDWKIPAGADPEALDVHVDVRCRIEVRLKPPVDRADELALFDAEGEGVDLIEMNEESVHLNSSVPLVGGRSGVLSASSSARTLELRKSGVGIERHAIELVPDQVNVIDL